MVDDLNMPVKACCSALGAWLDGKELLVTAHAISYGKGPS